jgi:hypothetical protein
MLDKSPHQIQVDKNHVFSSKLARFWMTLTQKKAKAGQSQRRALKNRKFELILQKRGSLSCGFSPATSFCPDAPCQGHLLPLMIPKILIFRRIDSPIVALTTRNIAEFGKTCFK